MDYLADRPLHGVAPGTSLADAPVLAPEEDAERENPSLQFVSFLQERGQLAQQLAECLDRLSANEIDAAVVLMHKLVYTLNKYQECSHLLDHDLAALLTPLLKHAFAALSRPLSDSAAGLQVVCSIVYTLCKIRGFKTVSRFFSPDIDAVAPVWARFALMSAHESQNQHDALHEQWQTKYTLLLWLSVLVLVPFDLSLFSEKENESLVEKIIFHVRFTLQTSGPLSEVSAFLLSRLLTRPDIIESSIFSNFMQSIEKDLSSTQPYVVAGSLRVICLIFKIGTRNLLAPIALTLFRSADLYTSGDMRWANNALIRKMSVKATQRIALVCLSPTLSLWRYSRGHRNILSGTGQIKIQSKSTETETTRTTTPAVTNIPDHNKAAPGEELEIVEHVIGLSLSALGDRDGDVRWSGAKAIARMCERLSLPFADQVIGHLLGNFEHIEKEHEWHGSLLSLAEFGRRGILLPERLHTAVSVVVKGLLFDPPHAFSSSGASVRDAACFACWAFCRAYPPEILASHTEALVTSLVNVAIFDREINCRRAASAALQEFVGRQRDNVIDGITLLTHADYFAVGNRLCCATVVAPNIAKLPTYQDAIIQHIFQKKLGYFDALCRVETSLCLRNLCQAVPHKISSHLPALVPLALSENLFVRHGAVLALAEILRGLWEHDRPNFEKHVSPELQKEIRNVVPNLEKARLYRGRGGELVRAAVCNLIEWMCRTLKLPEKTCLRFNETIQENLAHPQEKVQESAVSAFSGLCTHLFASISPASSTTICSQLFSQKENELPSTRRGLALSLGVFPAHILEISENFPGIISTLDYCSKIHNRPDFDDVETRRNAVVSLSKLSHTLRSSPRLTVQWESWSEFVLRVCLLGLEDHTIDNRGDVGSWVRESCALTLLEWLRCTVSAQTLINNFSETLFFGDDAFAQDFMRKNRKNPAHCLSVAC
eukprot:TRINITY_DN5246_c0_g1_i1.p1 TRINITY_DN5246_c0_g1~~TRINITY_DN5246_c0_g1_i1.p1  ORF type:complete len:953 (-),score=244.07 TRINITY_DN5246_c0_g1_i1:1026-3854(-)